jgi:hypothetical protein
VPAHGEQLGRAGEQFLPGDQSRPFGVRAAGQHRGDGEEQLIQQPAVARLCCSSSEKNGIGPSTTWLIRQPGPPWHSVGNAVTSFSWPSYLLVAS